MQNVHFVALGGVDGRFSRFVDRARLEAFYQYFQLLNCIDEEGKFSSKVLPPGTEMSEIAVDLEKSESLLILPLQAEVLRGLGKIDGHGYRWYIPVTLEGGTDRVFFEDGNFYLASLYFKSERGRKQLC